MNKQVEFARVKMTMLEAQRRLAHPDLVKLILQKTPEERARLRQEREHEKTSKML